MFGFGAVLSRAGMNRAGMSISAIRRSGFVTGCLIIACLRRASKCVEQCVCECGACLNTEHV